MPASKQKTLLASIHDVGPGFADEIDQLVSLYSSQLGEARFAMLVVPNHWGENPITAGTPFADRLRDWASQGVEMFVHGWFHKDMASGHDGLAGFKARHMTAGEGEFLGLSQIEAAKRMADGRKLIEDITGKEVAGFIAPAWLYGNEALQALQDSDFALAEDHMKVWRPNCRTALARGPVITWASRSPMRTASSLAFAALARHALAPLRTVRVAAHPGDTSNPAILNSIERTLAVLSKDRIAERYSHLLT